MVKDEPVSLTRQTIYCMIPIMDIYAAYRVKRLRKYFILILGVVGVPVSIISSVLFPKNPDLAEGFYHLMIFYYGVDDNQFIFSIVVQIVTILFAIFLIRRWSKQWNKKFH